MQGEHHHGVLADARFLGPAATQPEFDLVQIDYYPAMLPGGALRVYGELYEVNEDTLRALDRLEEVPDYYERKTITLADGSQAQSYLMPRTRAGQAAAIPSGYFRMRTAPPKRL
jgi:gamma-glutamylcyclotransferase (GGCT)/AIG2-like uncharacterized protein YtfP